MKTFFLRYQPNLQIVGNHKNGHTELATYGGKGMNVMRNRRTTL